MLILQTHEDWLREARQRFGYDPINWRFKCVRCGHVQSMASFLERDPSMELEKLKTIVHFSCQGRWHKEVGCDWTLGGFLQIHQKEVLIEGHKTPCFLFDGEEGGGV